MNIDSALEKLDEKQKIARVVARTLNDYPHIDSLDSLAGLLNREGIRVRVSRHADGAIFGLSFAFGDTEYKGSDAGASWTLIKEKLATTFWGNPIQDDKGQQKNIIDKVRFGEFMSKDERRRFELHPVDFINSTHVQKKRLLLTQLSVNAPKTHNELKKLLSLSGAEVKYISVDTFTVSDIDVGGVRVSELFENGYRELNKLVEKNAANTVYAVVKNSSGDAKQIVAELQKNFPYDTVSLRGQQLFIGNKSCPLRGQQPVPTEGLTEDKKARATKKGILSSGGRRLDGGSHHFRGETLAEQEERLRRQMGN